LELLSGHDGGDPEVPLGLRLLQIGPHMVELPIVPPRAVGLLQMEDGNPVFGRECLHLAPEAIADLLQ
jgi:hypothetical protein